MKWSDQGLLWVDYLSCIFKIFVLDNPLYTIAAIFAESVSLEVEDPLPPKRKQDWIYYEVLPIVHPSVVASAFTAEPPLVQGDNLSSTQALTLTCPQGFPFSGEVYAERCIGRVDDSIIITIIFTNSLMYIVVCHFIPKPVTSSSVLHCGISISKSLVLFQRVYVFLTKRNPWPKSFPSWYST